jgi:hypothetical protein
MDNKTHLQRKIAGLKIDIGDVDVCSLEGLISMIESNQLTFDDKLEIDTEDIIRRLETIQERLSK